ncbi:hypothetical protein Cni_G18592 [Canna indica]|uniref:Uncharacterized protein n=1 Tax=Canna indica TaxID=4628 RepID=A0AAQ3QG76_9LILI|nr:hypothetical protein Cni_G18592 [Canna indica]
MYIGRRGRQFVEERETKKMADEGKATERGGLSNLQSFLDAATPSVPAHQLPEGGDGAQFFYLEEFWEQYNEPSAYGLDVPVYLQIGEVSQYFVPSLSALQIYTRKAPLAAASRGDEVANPSSDDVAEDDIGQLYIEFFERTLPHARRPLVDKIAELAETYPELNSFKSTELSRASWISVAWYPIYHIPSTRNVKGFATCFLTYHALSSFSKDVIHGSTTSEAPSSGTTSEMKPEEGSFISLPPFGLATYKLQRQGSLWTMPGSGDSERLGSLFMAADSWLKQLKVRHHDFIYFSSHFM